MKKQKRDTDKEITGAEAPKSAGAENGRGAGTENGRETGTETGRGAGAESERETGTETGRGAKAKRAQKKKFPAGLITRGAVYIALGVICLILPYFFEATDILMATVVAVVIAMARIEHGLPFGLAVYLGVSILGFILMPSNTGVILFALSFGWFPLLHVLLLRRIGRTWAVRLIDCAAFTLVFTAVVILFMKSFVSGADTASGFKKVFEFLSVDGGSFLEKLEEPFLFGKSRGEALTVGLYALFALPFSFIFSLFLDVFTRFYVYKIRPRLKKAQLVK